MQRSERLLKASVAACLSTGVAVAMHVAGGGAVPSAAGVAVPLLLAFAVSAQLAGNASRWRLGAAVVFSQFVFHTLFSWGVGASVSVAPGQGPHAGHGTQGLALDVTGVGHLAHAHFTPTMIAAHALAALGTYAVLRHADVLLDAGRRWALWLVPQLHVHAKWRPAPLGINVPSPRPTLLRSRIASSPRGLRGPPLFFA